MSGFVGFHAKKRRRNIFIISSFIIIIIILFFILPSLQIENYEIKPNENIIPNPEEELTSLTSINEELELSIFQKDQKIKFRDGQIINLQNELKNIKSKYETVILELKVFKDESENEILSSSNEYKLLKEKFTNLNIKNDKNNDIIKNLNKKIEELNNKFLLIDEEENSIILENQKLKNDNNIFSNKNLKLEKIIADLKNIINEQKIEINFYLEQIKKLKDRSHHGS